MVWASAVVGSSTAAAAGDLVRADDNPCRIVAEEAAADRHCMQVGEGSSRHIVVEAAGRSLLHCNPRRGTQT